MSRDYEVVIVGCGPAGNTLAFQLARRGLHVLLLEKERLPRKKVCGGGLSRKSINELPYSVEPVCERIIDTAVLTGGGDRVLVKPIPRCGAMVQRDLLDAFMTRKAVEAGAVLEEDCRFETYEGSHHRLEVHTNRGTFKAKVLVGADGVYSRVRRQLHPGRTVKLAPAIEARVYVDPGQLEKHGARAWFDLGSIRGGYGWIFPKGDHFNVGLYRFLKRKDNLDLRSMLQTMVRTHPILREHREVVIQAFSIPLRPVSRVLAKDGVVLVGDAAGLAEAFYGEGIYYAVKSANIAAESIHGWLSGKTSLADYNRRMLGIQVDSWFSRRLAGGFYRLPGWVSDTMLRNPMVNELFGRLVTGRMSPPECLVVTAGLLPIWFWLPRDETMGVDAASASTSI